MNKLIIRNDRDLNGLLEECKNAKIFAVDTETISLEDRTMIGMSIATNSYAWYIPVSLLPVKSFKSVIQELLESEEYIKIFHNAKFDYKVFKKIGISINRYYDTMIMAWLVEVGKRQKFGLKLLAQEVLGVSMTKYKEVNPDNLEEFADYAMDDTIYTYQLFKHYEPLLGKAERKVLKFVEMPCVEMVAEMEDRGITINVHAFKSLKSKLEKEITKLKVEIIQETVKTGYIPNVAKIPTFNIDTTQHVKDYLNYLGFNLSSTSKSVLSKLENGWVTKLIEYRSLKKVDEYKSKILKYELEKEVKISGFKLPLSEKNRALMVFNPSSPDQVKAYLHSVGIMVEKTGVKELSRHKRNKWVAKMLEYRKLSKLYTSFVENLLPKILKNNGRLYGSFNQIGTQTGRFSSSEPNFQNFPAHDKFHYRGLFIPTEGYKIVVADYSQLESRVLAHFSKDRKMIEFFESGHDLHSSTAHSMFKLPCKVEEVKEKYYEERFRAKTINFGLAYGRGPSSLAEQLNVSKSKAEELIDLYFQQFPSVKGYIKQVQMDARSCGYVATLFGRKRYFPQLNEIGKSDKSIYTLLGEVDRRSINTKIQGSAADLTKKAMIDLYKVIKQRNDGAYILAQVHDEIVMECPEEVADEYADILQRCMENAVKLRVPLIAESQIGNSWEEAK